MIVGHIGGAGAPYEIQKSLRFRSAASAYLSRASTSAGTSSTTWTYSGWVKRGVLGSGTQDVLRCHYSATYHIGMYFDSSGSFGIVQWTGSAAINLHTTQVLRDPSAWYHVVVAVDSTQVTASNRVKIYVNGVQVTAFSAAVYPPQNSDTYMSGAGGGWTRKIGQFYDFATTAYLDGYLSEINFIDGQALDASYFGEVSAETGAWIPKKYTGTYGTNGFYLPFNDGSSLANLTADRSGNGNNWTANNISLTAGVTYDWMDDTPSNNFAVLNPINPLRNTTSVVSWANLRITMGSAVDCDASGSFAVDSGKWYFEVTRTSAASVCIVGICNPLSGVNNRYGYVDDGLKVSVISGSLSSSAYGAVYVNNDVVGVAFDSGVGTLEFFKNGVSQGIAFSSIPTSNQWAPYGYVNPQEGGTETIDFNFGQRPFAYAPPAGFKALCTKNLPAPSILNPKKHFDAKTYIGNGSTQDITGIQFQPDFVWAKHRGAVANHYLHDAVRGVGQALYSNLTSAEGTPGNAVTALNSNGFTVGSNVEVNGNAGPIVSWLWKAGGAPVTNNAGSIQSQVSANPQAGFSIVTYTGTGANATVGHGLGVAPKMVIVKSRNAANNWPVWHGSIAGTQFLLLNTVDAVGTAANVWNSTAPTSGVFSVGTNVGTNNSGTAHVAYCFAEIPGYSKIGSYVGNGSADGPFVYCGFRPRLVMIKRVDAAGTFWILHDTARSPSNAAPQRLFPNASDAEGSTSAGDIDILSNGFKLRTTDTGYNANGGTYIFAAFAEQPFQFANAR